MVIVCLPNQPGVLIRYLHWDHLTDGGMRWYYAAPEMLTDPVSAYSAGLITHQEMGERLQELAASTLRSLQGAADDLAAWTKEVNP